jgi:hypothetical protein
MVLRRRARKRLPLLVINDISENRRDAPVIRGFIRSIYGRQGSIVLASKIREKVFSFLARQPKYDLIFLGATGGPKIFMGRELSRLGKSVKEIPYSIHMQQETWPSTVLREAAKLGEKPRILILDSDVGPVLHTANKLANAKKVIAIAKKDAVVHVVAGAASSAARKRLDFNFVAYPTSAKPVRLSELMHRYEAVTLVHKGRIFKKTKEADALLERLRELQRKRGMTGTLPH